MYMLLVYICVHASVLSCVSTNIYLMIEDFSIANGNLYIYSIRSYIKNERYKRNEGNDQKKMKKKTGKVIETAGKNHKNRL